MWTLPQDVQSFWLLFTAHEEPVQVLQATVGSAAAAGVDDGIHVSSSCSSSSSSSWQQCYHWQWWTQWCRHVFRCRVRRHLAWHSLSVLSLSLSLLVCAMFNLIAVVFCIALHSHTFDVANDSISITRYFQYHCLHVYLITICNCLQPQERIFLEIWLIACVETLKLKKSLPCLFDWW